jgi:RimJ/RimL family protein N-acetyltransferase
MREEYITELLPFINNPLVIRGTMAQPPLTYEEELEWYHSLAKSKQHQRVFAVLRQTEDSQEYIGHTGLHKISYPDGLATTGTLLGKIEHWNKGIGTEAKLLLQYHGFRKLGLRMLRSSVKAFNAPSLGHLLKTGYEIVGRSRASSLP